LARIFVVAGLTYAYAVAYILIITGFAYALWYVKNRKLRSSRLVDRFLFLIVVGAAGYICVRLTVTFVGNLSLPYVLTSALNWFVLNLVVYSATITALVFYLWNDVILCVKNWRRRK